MLGEKWPSEIVSGFPKPAPGKRVSEFFRKHNLMTRNITFLRKNDKTGASCSLCSDRTILSHLVALLNHRDFCWCLMPLIHAPFFRAL